MPPRLFVSFLVIILPTAFQLSHNANLLPNKLSRSEIRIRIRIRICIGRHHLYHQHWLLLPTPSALGRDDKDDEEDKGGGGGGGGGGASEEGLSVLERGDDDCWLLLMRLRRWK